MEYRRHVGTNDGRVCLHVSIEMVLANKHAKTTTITMVVTFFSPHSFVCCRLSVPYPTPHRHIATSHEQASGRQQATDDVV